MYSIFWTNALNPYQSKLRAIRQRPRNIGSHRTAWWAREVSNLQPDRYIRLAVHIS
jgi:hypothetical protein